MKWLSWKCETVGNVFVWKKVFMKRKIYLLKTNKMASFFSFDAKTLMTLSKNINQANSNVLLFGCSQTSIWIHVVVQTSQFETHNLSLKNFYPTGTAYHQIGYRPRKVPKILKLNKKTVDGNSIRRLIRNRKVLQWLGISFDPFVPKIGETNKLKVWNVFLPPIILISFIPYLNITERRSCSGNFINDVVRRFRLLAHRVLNGRKRVWLGKKKKTFGHDDIRSNSVLIIKRGRMWIKKPALFQCFSVSFFLSSDIENWV